MLLDILAEAKIYLTPNAQRVLEKRYLLRNNQGELVETPEAMFHRVARAIASAENEYHQADVEAVESDFYRIMSNLEFLPNSTTLLNAGTDVGQLFSCFVLPVSDSIEEIFESAKHAALIQKSGGGIGFNFSNIRCKSSGVAGRLGIASGPVALIDIFSRVSDYIRQGGIRRGCNSAVLSVTHPDILDYIRVKANPEVLTNFYTSVSVTDDFMRCVKDGSNYSLLDPCSGNSVGQLNARYVFDQIVDQSWRTGDPGLVFADRINLENPTPDLGRLEAITGCGEQALLPYESCPLGSINLVAMLKIDGGEQKIDWEKFARTVHLAIRFLDNVIEVNKFPIQETEEASKRTRKIGLGIMGFADMLLRLGVPYNSTKAISIAEEIMEFINDMTTMSSNLLARERGVYPAWHGSIHDTQHLPLRNANCTAIAPAGTLSIIAGVSSGIEPIFAAVFVRNILDGENLLEINDYFEEVAKKRGFYTRQLLEQLVANNHLHDRKEIPEDVRRIFVTAHRISPDWHVRLQAAFQRHSSSAVSKTVNFPKSATKEDIANVFMMAFDQGLKGITVYRDRSRELQPLSTCEQGLKLVDAIFDQACEEKPAFEVSQ